MHSEPFDAHGSGAADGSELAADVTPSEQSDGVAAPRARSPKTAGSVAPMAAPRSTSAKARGPRTAAAKPAAPRNTPQRTGGARKPAGAKPAGVPGSETPAPRARKAPAAAARARTAPAASKTAPKPAPSPDSRVIVLAVAGLSKRFDDTLAVHGIDLQVRTGSIFGIVGPNGAGKTTTLSMITGLLRPDSGTVTVHGVNVWADPVAAKRQMGVLPDRLRLFDRLTGAQLLYYSGALRGLDRATVRKRSSDLASAFGLEDALGRLVTDYSAGMMKKIALAAAMIHSPRVLILDEPFEAVDPVSAANVIEILQRYAAAGGTVVLSSHSMDLIQRMCDSVAIVVRGEVLASGTVDEVRRGVSLEDRFIELAGGRKPAEGMEWLHTFSA